MTTGTHLHDPVTGQHLTFVKTGRETDGELLQVEVRLDPGGRVPRHAHARQDERVEVVAGTLAVRVGSVERTLEVGDRLDVPRRRVHLVRNAGQNEAVFLLEVRPARHMEAAMRGLFGLMNIVQPLARLRRRDR